jgi:hypothetical protein
MIGTSATKLTEPLPVLNALAARVSEGGERIAPHRVLAFLVGSPMTTQEHLQIGRALPAWFGCFGRDLAVELGEDFERLSGMIGQGQPLPDCDLSSGW